MKRGPKAPVRLDPLPGLDDLPPAGGDRVAAFAERYLTVPRGHGVGEPLVLRSWQHRIACQLFDAPRPWTAVLSLPRAQGKSTLAAVLALAEAHAGPPSAEVLCVAASGERQAAIVLGQAARMTAASPELADRTQVYRDRLVVPGTDAQVLTLPSDPAAVEGYDPSLVVVDELGHVREDVWESLVGYAGKRPASLVVAISTPASSEDSLMWRLVKARREAPDALHRLVEYAAPDGCDVADEAAWEAAMPALDDFCSRSAVRSKLTTLRPEAFRRYCLGQWTTAADDVWLPFGAWEACADPERTVPPGTPVVLGFDGSASGDSTAAVGCTLGDDDTPPHVFLVGLWENPGDRGWRVDRSLVDAAVERAFATWDVRELACDPWGWRDSIARWAARWPGRVVEWPTSVGSRMGPATDRMYQAVLDRTVSHAGNADLARHVNNCRARSTPVGDLVHKQAKSSPLKIDAAVAAIVAHDRAAWHRSRPRRSGRVHVFR
ncbi:MAG TPA: terminase large subunit [Acidimicrobiales bacterium]